jgi:hypothetical protein
MIEDHGRLTGLPDASAHARPGVNFQPAEGGQFSTGADTGWRWSECVKPVAGTESCQARHVGVVHSGRLAIKHEDGTEVEIGPGEAYVIEPSHDAWVVGDERFVGFEFEARSAEEYAKG